MSVTSITVNELAQRLGVNPQILLIDVRTPKEYAEVHAAAAASLPLDQMTRETLVRRYPAAAQNEVYLICQSGHRSSMAYAKLQKEGMTKLINVEGGTQAWCAAQLPVVNGPSTISLERQVRITAGFLVLLGALLAWLVHPVWIVLSAFVGAGLMFAGITGTCGMAVLLAYMPWNRR